MRALSMAIMMECVFQKTKRAGQTRQEVASRRDWHYNCWQYSLLALQHFNR